MMYPGPPATLCNRAGWFRRISHIFLGLGLVQQATSNVGPIRLPCILIEIRLKSLALKESLHHLARSTRPARDAILELLNGLDKQAVDGKNHEPRMFVPQAVCGKPKESTLQPISDDVSGP